MSSKGGGIGAVVAVEGVVNSAFPLSAAGAHQNQISQSSALSLTRITRLPRRGGCASRVLSDRLISPRRHIKASRILGGIMPSSYNPSITEGHDVESHQDSNSGYALTRGHTPIHHPRKPNLSRYEVAFVVLVFDCFRWKRGSHSDSALQRLSEGDEFTIAD